MPQVGLATWHTWGWGMASTPPGVAYLPTLGQVTLGVPAAAIAPGQAVGLSGPTACVPPPGWSAPSLLAPGACRESVLSHAGRDPRMPPSVRGEHVAAAIERGQRRALGAWEADTVRKREAAVETFAEWCRRLPHEFRADWGSVTPELAVGYLEGHYVPAHATREITFGFWGPAATTLEAHVSHLRSGFRLLGRVCPWGTAPPGACNPFESEVVSRYVAAYTRQHARAGFEAVAARPFSDAKLVALLRDLDERALAERNPVAGVLVARDQAVLCFLHECGKRGKDCGQLRWADFLDPSNRPLDPATWAPSAGDHVACRMFSKTYKTTREAAFTFVYPPAEGEQALNFLWRLERYVQARAAAQLPWGPSGWVFSPQGRNRVSLADAPLSSSSFGQRLRAHLERAGLDAGETAHGLRRQRTQALGDSGLAPEEVMEVMGMKSRRTYELYSDRTRPVRTT